MNYDTDVVCKEALWHMINYKDMYGHAMSKDALKSALADLETKDMDN